MKEIIKKIFTKKDVKPIGFSEFFTNTKSRDKKKIIKEVVKKSNKDQSDLIKRYDQKYKNS